MNWHWRRIAADRGYRNRSLYSVGANLSCLTYSILYGAELGQTVSGEIGRRLVARQRLGIFLFIIKFIGDQFDPLHWQEIYRREQLVRNDRRARSSSSPAV